MKNLFLASSFAEVVELFKKTEKGLAKNKTVTFIPTATLHEEVTFFVEDGKNALEKLGLIVDTLEISSAKNSEIERKLKDNDYIYVTGGNTFFLLQELRRTQADKIIIDQILSGKLYIGESAGSMILSPNIEYVMEMDDYKVAPNLKSFEALGLIDFYPLPHHTNFPFKEITENIISRHSEKIKLYPFSNTQAICVKGKNIELIE